MKFLVPDHTGHTEELFDVSNKVGLKDAMKRFDELMKTGNTPAKLQPNGTHKVDRNFDPTAEQVLFVPQLMGVLVTSQHQEPRTALFGS